MTEEERKEYQRKHIKIKSFLGQSCCQMCGRLTHRIFGIEFWVNNGCTLPCRPQKVYMDHLCKDCFQWINSGSGYQDQQLDETLTETLQTQKQNAT